MKNRKNCMKGGGGKPLPRHVSRKNPGDMIIVGHYSKSDSNCNLWLLMTKIFIIREHDFWKKSFYLWAYSSSRPPTPRVTRKKLKGELFPQKVYIQLKLHFQCHYSSLFFMQKRKVIIVTISGVYSQPPPTQPPPRGNFH